MPKVIFFKPYQGLTEDNGTTPVFVIVTDAENGLSGSTGSETFAVNRGKNITTAAIPPSSVATTSTRANRDLFGWFSLALCLSFFGLGIFFKLLDTWAPGSVLNFNAIRVRSHTQSVH